MNNLLRASQAQLQSEIQDLDESILEEISGGHDGVRLTTVIKNGVISEPSIDNVE